MKKAGLCIVLAIALVLLAGCAAGSNELVNSANAEGIVAGFWRGVWNGIIAPVTFVISLFNRNVQMYEVHNNGNWYNFGYLLGVIIIFGSGGSGAKGASARRSRR